MSRQQIERKPIHWIGSSLEDVKAFPDNIKRELGFDLDLVQQGLSPRDFKAMQNLGFGVMEIRVRDISGAYRLVYIAKLKKAIYCLHAFQKKTQKTSSQDLAVIKARYAALKELDDE
ncbi:type II toxin-antitoxin system RelE/ParE family toxin [Aggregatibacter actinomycetemcomitans]|uniref:type II toxin-antitoxin system RelE/ParE family toxin n=1 Tax=Aggregatibacter actinomycetemcomitans TaxID=714 RepID=UPI001E3B5B1D|nr:type II toxin-antitoxin system RelE/ParE family toxin [Aggregatibacter actinomycetemcomitans]